MVGACPSQSLGSRFPLQVLARITALWAFRCNRSREMRDHVGHDNSVACVDWSMKRTLIILFCVSMFFPWFSSMEHTYQSSLWTYSDQRRGGEKSYDWQFSIGGLTESTEWTRVRLGLPIQPITIDTQLSHGIVQVRIEPVNVMRNLIPAAIVALVLLAVRRLWMRPKAVSTTT